MSRVWSRCVGGLLDHHWGSWGWQVRPVGWTTHFCDHSLLSLHGFISGVLVRLCGSSGTWYSIFEVVVVVWVPVVARVVILVVVATIFVTSVGCDVATGQRGLGVKKGAVMSVGAGWLDLAGCSVVFGVFGVDLR